MIVKNESKIIKRCIDRLLPIVDAISICDTGSTDNTVDLINSFASKIPTNCITDPWVNFGHNRSRSFKEAVRFCTKLGWDLKTSYTLFVDADMLPVFKPEFKKDSLTSAGYRLIQKSGALSYANLRLGRMDCMWKSVGVTHEFWSITGAEDKDIKQIVDTAYIDDIGDGGSKNDKTDRDIRLLEQGLKEEPENKARYTFYLAQSYKDCKQFDKAIDLFVERIKIGGWAEEVWYAHYSLGLCFMLKHQMGQDKDRSFGMAVSWFWMAFNFRPSRRESLTKLALFYRLNGMNYETFQTAKLALKIPNTNDVLFVDTSSYEYEPEREIAISGYYIGHHDEARRAIEKLLRKKTVPDNERNVAMSNIVFYLYTLPLSNVVKTPSVFEDGFLASTPSFSGNHVLVRHVNYTINEKTGEYHYPTNCLTRNVLYNKQTPDKKRELVEDLEIYRTKNIRIRGMEDVRLFTWMGELWGIATTWRFTNCPNMAMFPIDTSGEGDIQLKNIYHLNFAPTGCEKNWMPIDSDTEKLNIIYSHSPMTIIVVSKPDADNKGVVVPQRVYQINAGEKKLDTFRGSCKPIRYREYYVGVIHEVSMQKGRRAYIHRFVWYNKELKPIRFSQVFNFKHIGIEYTMGLEWDENHSVFTMGFSFKDRESYRGVLSEEEFLKLELYDIDTDSCFKCIVNM